MIKRFVTIGLAAGLVLGALGMPADAKKKKKKPPAPPTPIATVMYLDGTTQFGEQEMANVPVARPGTYLKLTKEAGTAEKSMGVPDYSVGPNATCAGNSLVPVFVGNVTGHISGTMTINFLAQGTPGSTANVNIWPDITAQTCNEEYPEPAGSVEVTLPSSKGIVTATIEGLDFDVQSVLMIQVTPTSGALTAPQPPPTYGRVYYGTGDTKVEYACLPAAGAASCLPS